MEGGRDNNPLVEAPSPKGGVMSGFTSATTGISAILDSHHQIVPLSSWCTITSQFLSSVASSYSSYLLAFGSELGGL
jgi:hypothetical protein